MKTVKKSRNYYWLCCRLSEPLFARLRGSTLARVMYLMTFLTPEGYLKDGNNFIKKQNLQDYLEVSRREQYRFWNEVSSANILHEQNDYLYSNPEYFICGNINTSQRRHIKEEKLYPIKIYSDSVRELYGQVQNGSMKQLGYLFRILPYVNKEYNICCFDPLETNIDYIEPMTLGDFADIVGYDRSSANKLAKILHKPTFNVNGEQKNAMRYVAANSIDIEAYGMFINPRVYYAGSDWSKVEVLCAF